MVKKTILVTGGNKGIGFEICRLLAAEGHRVILCGRNLDALKAAQEKLKLKDNPVFIELLDVLAIDTYPDFFKRVDAQFGSIDVLINNAAIFFKETDDLESLTYETFDQTLKTNLYGPIFLTKTFLPHIIQQNGRIVNISSELGVMSRMGARFLSYRISKSALNAFTIHTAKEHPEITAVAAHPGRVNTDMSGSKTAREPQEAAEHIAWLATSPEVVSGKLYFDKKILDW